MFVCLLIRHAESEQADVLGRRAQAGLTYEGKRQSEILAEEIAALHPDAIYSSPLTRAVQTAAVLADRLGLAVQIGEPLREMDFGEWDGQTPTGLAHLAAWRQFNSVRSRSRCPGGESMREVQRRTVSFLERLGARHPNGAVACISHADVIRAALCQYRGISLDDFLTLEVAPASVHRVALA
ncbi:MAG TPA: histidine phosphatase family protein [Bryobacteraceae bacterium]|nr:histidine phosphatase family protein [Bryobacteraceae bacterium]